MPWTLSGFADEADENSTVQVQVIQECGFSHIDLRNLDGFNICELPIDHARDVRQKLDTAGVKVGMFGSPIGKIDIADDFKIDADKLRHLGELAKVFDCHRVRIFSYFNKADAPMPKWKAEALDRLKKLRDLAGRLGLVLYHENEHLIYGDTLEHVQDIAALRDGKRFRLIFDFDNYNQVGMDVWACWEALRDRTDAFHLKDSDKDCQHVPIGQGAGRARDILADAEARGWQGHLALEPHLMRSAAVMATGPGGQANQAFADMTPVEAWVAAAGYAKGLLADVGATIA